MPAQEETQSVTVKTWSLNTRSDVTEFQDDMFGLGFVCKVWLLPAAPPAQQIQVQVDLPDKPLTPLLIDRYGTTVRGTIIGDTLINIELLPETEAEA